MVFKKGHQGYWRGKHFSEEHKRKVGDGNRGKVLSDETKAKISASRKRLWENPQFHERMCKSFKGRQHSEKTRQQISETLKMKYSSGEIVVPFKGRKHTEETRQKMSENRSDITGENNPMWGRHHTDEAKEKLSKVMSNAWGRGCFDDVDWEEMNREKWRNPEYRDRTRRKMMQGNRIKPNKPEQFLIDLFEEYGLPFKYVGAGDFILGGKCPDFLNYDGEKQLIELYGDYWHDGDDPQERIDFFKQYGFDALVVWERELENPAGVLGRVEAFI